MPLFRDENPALGAQVTVKEISGFGSGNPVVNYFKPQTREYISFIQGQATVPATQFVFVAPFACQVVSVKATWTVVSTSGTLQVVKFQQASLPSAPSTAANGTTIVNLLSSTINLAGTVNTTNVGSLSSASGSPLVLATGDQIALQFGGTMTGQAGLLVQVEIAQIG